MLHQALTGIRTEQKFISDCRYRVIESSSLVPVLFREVFSHPYISLFHLLVNGFSVIQLSLHKEPPEVGLVKKLTGSLY